MLTLPNQLSCEMVERKYIYFPKSSDHNAQFRLTIQAQIGVYYVEEMKLGWFCSSGIRLLLPSIQNVLQPTWKEPCNINYNSGYDQIKATSSNVLAGSHQTEDKGKSSLVQRDKINLPGFSFYFFNLGKVLKFFNFYSALKNNSVSGFGIKINK